MYPCDQISGRLVAGLGTFAKGLYYIHVVTANGSEVFKITLN